MRFFISSLVYLLASLLDSHHGVVSSYQMPRIIQGGMGVRISSWQLAREVSRKGELGVISGTAVDSVLVRELQSGKSNDGRCESIVTCVSFSFDFPLKKTLP